MKILLGYRQDWRSNKPVETYSRSMHHYLEKFLRHNVTPIGEGHDIESPEEINNPTDFDLFLELECGRNSKGEHNYFQPDFNLSIPSAVWFIDSHGNGSLHHRIMDHYDHVFFAVWSCRDLFVKHKSSHFCPNATDLRWFGMSNFVHITPHLDFGFFGSRKGLPRADKMIEICEKHNWGYSVKQIGKAYRHKWPQTGEAMSACENLFNHGQKHDINLRVFESMAIGRPLINDHDTRSGIDKLFEPWEHFIPYESYTFARLEEAMLWVLENEDKAHSIAKAAYEEVRLKHTVRHRAQQIIEVVNA